MFKCRKRTIISFITVNFFALVSFGQDKLIQYVNPIIGTGGHGHAFPGAVLPFGMVQLSPDTRIDGSWDGCSGYHYSDNIIYGFSHTHLSGTGCSDWGDVMLMPMAGKASLDKQVYSSKFSHAKEKASAGFYEVVLDDEKIKAELTVTPRTGIHRYTFPKQTNASIILDLLHRDKLLSGNIKIVDSVTITGYRISEAWAKEQHCYFAIKFSKPIIGNELRKNIILKDNYDGAVFKFKLPANSELIIKVAISGVSEDGALNNLNTEAQHWDFNKYKAEAEETWNEQLKKILVTDPDKNKLTTFYTALYHCCIHPSLNMDVDNKYRGRDNKIHTAANFTNYTAFSLWDTYRAVHPLFNIIERERSSDFVKTFLTQYLQSGRLPVWELSGNETDCMIGFHAVSVIADAMVKGITNFDSVTTYKSVIAAATYSNFGIATFNRKGFLSADDEPESVSKTLEYSYDSWCVAQIMKTLNKEEEFNYYLKRSQGYRNLVDPSTGFMRPRKNGNWYSPFDPREVNNHYTEGNSWQYSFYAPQDINGLITLTGGPKKFEQKLDSLFSTSNKTTGRTQNDITGLIGQYAHGNEPSHHMAYLYNYIGKPEKTQQLVGKIMNEFYKNSPDGLIGNEDCGQMSAWYIFSALGFYPVCPGSKDYVIGKPLFQSVQIKIADTTFTINKEGSGLKPIKSVSLNNLRLGSSISHQQIMNGGQMTVLFKTASDSTGNFAQIPSQRPQSKVNLPFIPAPVIESAKATFDSVCEVKLTANFVNKPKIVYTTTGTEPTKNSTIYTKPFLITNSSHIKAKVFSDNDSSETVEARLYKRPNNWKINIRSKYNKQYTAGGDEGIIDGIYGDINWRKGEWQGYQYTDFECVIDLREEKAINSVAINCLQDTRSWIIFPKEIEIYISADNKNFTLLEKTGNEIDPKDYTIQIKKFTVQLVEKPKPRYIKIVAKNFGTLPQWHEGKGDGAFIFVDEIEIK